MPSSPRPILKLPPSPTLTATSPLPFPSSRLPLSDSPRVHFPPTPTMTQMEITHSSFIYDRKPIVVLPNACALPERGDRSVDSSESDLDRPCPRRKKKALKAGYFHPSAFEVVDGDSEQPPDLSACSLLFTRDASSLSSSYRIHPDPHPTTNLNSERKAFIKSSGAARGTAHFRTVSIQTIGRAAALDPASDAGSCDYSPSSLAHATSQMDACQFMQHIPHMDLLSLPFIMPPPPPPKKQSALRNGSDCPSYYAHKKRGTPAARSRTITTGISATNNFERTRGKVVGSSNPGCAGFNNSEGFYSEPGLEGCLGGF